MTNRREVTHSAKESIGYGIARAELSKSGGLEDYNDKKILECR